MDREINKDVRSNKINKMIIILIFVIFILIGICIFVLPRYFGGFLLEEGEKISLGNMNFVNVYENECLTHIRIVSEENENNDTKSEIIYTFKDDKCISERVRYVFVDEIVANEQYEKWKEIDMMNLVKNGNEVCFNSDGNIGKLKQEILDNISLEYIIY